MDPASTLAPNLAPLAALLGTWKGDGAGTYPTIDDFSYTEELTFTDVGKPFLHYIQRTWAPNGSPMHTETGYLRAPRDGVAEFVLAQPTGQAELCEGTVVAEADTVVVEFDSRVVGTATAKEVVTTRRRYEIAGDRMVTTFAMAAVGVPLTHHLRSELRRV